MFIIYIKNRIIKKSMLPALFFSYLVYPIYKLYSVVFYVLSQTKQLIASIFSNIIFASAPGFVRGIKAYWYVSTRSVPKAVARGKIRLEGNYYHYYTSGKRSCHYDNTPMQYTANYTAVMAVKMTIFSLM